MIFFQIGLVLIQIGPICVEIGTVRVAYSADIPAKNPLASAPTAQVTPHEP